MPLVQAARHRATTHLVGRLGERVTDRPVGTSDVGARRLDLDASVSPLRAIDANAIPRKLRKQHYISDSVLIRRPRVSGVPIVRFDPRDQSEGECLLDAEDPLLRVLGGSKLAHAVLRLQREQRLRLTVSAPRAAHRRSHSRLPREVQSRVDHRLIEVRVSIEAHSELGGDGAVQTHPWREIQTQSIGARIGRRRCGVDRRGVARRIPWAHRTEVVVRRRLVLHVDSPFQQESLAHVERPILADAEPPHGAPIQYGRWNSLVDGSAVTPPFQRADRDDAPHPRASAKSIVPRQPRVVAPVSAGDARLVVEQIAEGVVGTKEVQRDTAIAADVVLRLGEQIVVARADRVAHVGELERYVEVTRTRGDEPPALPSAEPTLRRGSRVHDADAERRTRAVGARLSGDECEHAGQSVTVLRGETARRQRRAAERLDVDDGERAADVLQVKGLDELEAVQGDVQLVARDARQPRDGAVDVLADLRDRLEPLARERIGRRETRLEQTEVAGGDDDLREGDGGTAQLQGEQALDQILRVTNGRHERLEAKTENSHVVAARRHAADGELPVLTRVRAEPRADEINASAEHGCGGRRVADMAAQARGRCNARGAAHEDDLPRGRDEGAERRVLQRAEDRRARRHAIEATRRTRAEPWQRVVEGDAHVGLRSDAYDECAKRSGEGEVQRRVEPSVARRGGQRHEARYAVGGAGALRRESSAWETEREQQQRSGQLHRGRARASVAHHSLLAITMRSPTRVQRAPSAAASASSTRGSGSSWKRADTVRRARSSPATSMRTSNRRPSSTAASPSVNPSSTIPPRVHSSQRSTSSSFTSVMAPSFATRPRWPATSSIGAANGRSGRSTTLPWVTITS